MRIGVNLLYLLPNVVGGTQSYATGLLEAFCKIAISSEFFLFVNTETYRSGLFRKGDWHVVHCPVPASYRFVRYGWEQFILPHQIKRYRIELLHSLGYVQPLRLPCKSVVTIHDLNFLNIGHMMPWSRKTALQFFVKQSAKAADHIITVSEFSKKQIVEVLGIPPEKVTVTYNAVKEVPKNPADFEEITQRYGITKPYILGLSSQSPHKNVTSLVKAFEVLKRQGYSDLKLVLAGHLPVGTSDLKHAVQESKARKDIFFTGYVPDRILAALYAHAEVFVFPSFYEGFGIPVLEAFLYGTPVACSKVAALPEIAGDAALYFDPNNLQEMTNVIDYLLTHEDERRALVERGKKRVTLFTWEETARRTLDVYRRVLEE